MSNQKPRSRMHHGLALTCRGNTLVPILIALAISSAATIAFLDQGSKLNEKQNMTKAPDEVLEYIQEWVNLKKGKGSSAIIASDLSFHRKTNIFNQTVVYQETVPGKTGAKRLEYPTETRKECEKLKSIFSKYKIIQEVSCSSRTLYIYLRYN
jgi:hypothetical protein